MHLTTTKQLGTLEVLLAKELSMYLPGHENGGTWKPFYWDSAVQPAFKPHHLAQAQGWIKETDPGCALLNWLATEESGVASPNISQYWNGDNDAEKILLTDTQRQQRQNIYENILTYLQTTASQLEAFTLSIKPTYTYNRVDDQWSFLIWQQPNGDWLGLAPTMPSETNSRIDAAEKVDSNMTGSYIPEAFHMSAQSSAQPSTQSIEAQKVADNIDADTLPNELKALLSEVPPIKIYGWYAGGYNHVHSYGLRVAGAKSKKAVIEALWQSTRFLEIIPFEQFKLNSNYYARYNKDVVSRYTRIHRFLSAAVSAPMLYHFCFWDLEMLYIMGEVAPGDYVGMQLESQFIYNP